jgi:hypothetical protein
MRATVGLVVSATVSCAVACSGSVLQQSASGSTGSGGHATAVPDAGTLAAPPPPGPMHYGDGNVPKTFAITRLYLGDTDPNGTPDAKNGWRSWGYDLDGQGDTATTIHHCQPVGGVDPKRLANGNNGIDNSFGENILPILFGISSKTPAAVNAALAAGGPTLLITINQLGLGANYNPLSSIFIAGADLGSPPKLDGTDVWPFEQGSSVGLLASYVTGNTWVSGPPTTMGLVTITLALPGSPAIKLGLPIGHAIVAMKLDASHQHATGGVIAGVISTSDFTKEILTLQAQFDPSFCFEGPDNSIIAQITQASDIMRDGTQDPSKTCDGISIGLGFDAEPVLLGGGVTPPPPPNPCGDGGP